MSTNSKHQVMTCGACAVVVDEYGETTTSIDHMVNGVTRPFARDGRRSAPRRAVATKRA